MIKSILFVCLGNICRSPLAEGIAREIINRNKLDIKVDSAGTSGFHSGEPPHHLSCEVAKQHNININNLRSRQINLYDDIKFNMIIVMDSNNYNDLIKIGFDRGKVSKLGDYGLNGVDIPDPYYLQQDGFEKVYKMIENALENLFQTLK